VNGDFRLNLLINIDLLAVPLEKPQIVPNRIGSRGQSLVGRRPVGGTTEQIEHAHLRFHALWP
jgi:hypothetical protein